MTGPCWDGMEGMEGMGGTFLVAVLGGGPLEGIEGMFTFFWPLEEGALEGMEGMEGMFGFGWAFDGAVGCTLGGGARFVLGRGGATGLEFPGVFLAAEGRVDGGVVLVVDALFT